MLSSKPQPGTPPQLAVDSPAPLGELAPILEARNIAVASAPDGHVLLVRPDSVLVETPATSDQSSPIARLVDKFNAARAEEIRAGLFNKEAAFLKVELQVEQPPKRSEGESRLSVSTVNAFRTAASESVDANGNAAPIRAEYNHVVIGAQSVHGSPLGVNASWAGEMAFTGQIVDTKGGRRAMLTTADPSVPPTFLRTALDIDGHERPQVLVLDTGLRTVVPKATAARRAAHGELQRCVVHRNWLVDANPGDVDDEDEEFDPPAISSSTTPSTVAPDRLLDFEAGHGTFIAGIIRQICPDAVIHTAGVLSSFGDGDVEGVLANLGRILSELAESDTTIDIVVMSFGTNLIDDDAGFFGSELTRVLGGALAVAAAGNQDTCRPYFPAALADVIGVGGLAADGKAWFTNFGGWVDACAPAVDVVSTFFNDFQEVIDGQQKRQYEQWARWSGTSFSAPKVAAVIAQEMYLNQVSAKEAWKRVTSHKHLRYPDLGIVFNV